MLKINERKHVVEVAKKNPKMGLTEEYSLKKKCTNGTQNIPLKIGLGSAQGWGIRWFWFFITIMTDKRVMAAYITRVQFPKVSKWLRNIDKNNIP